MVSVLLKDFAIDARSASYPPPCGVRGVDRVFDGIAERGRPAGEIRVSKIEGDVSGGIRRGMMAFGASECGVPQPCFDAGSEQRNDKSRDSSDFGSGGAGRKFVARVTPDEARGLHFGTRIGRADGDDGRRLRSGAESASGQISCESSSLTQRRFEFGDMVWAKVKSHPWWPGYIFDDAFASSSVRLTRRDGHVLVAFFGDSSYGWFDPAELVPFDVYYVEKSMLSTSRDFMNAVDEAVDELRRRSSLGLACRCRNPFNFRQASVKGYSIVDLDYFEPGSVYTGKQINNARDDFQPVEMLSFLQKLALNPRSNDTRDCDWIKRSAAVIAYRRAVFEEFDVTYAQAFGVEPILPTRNAMGVLELPNKVLPQALLSGLLVKPKGSGKNSSVPLTFKDPSKRRDKCLFKKREGANEARAVTAKPSVDGYVLQKRPVATQAGTGREPKSDGRKLAVADVGLVSRQHSGRGIVLPTSAAVISSTSQAAAHGTVPATGSGGSDDRALQLKCGVKEKNVLQETSGKMTLDGAVQPLNRDIGGSSGVMAKLESSETGQVVGDFQQHDQTIGDARLPSVTSGSDGLIKGEKRPREDSTLEMKEKNKRKKDVTLEARRDDQLKRTKIVKDTEALGKSAGKSIGVISENSSESSSKPLISMPELEIGTMKPEMTDLVNDLLALAVDPSHGIERGTPSIAQQVFLKFRSLVYRKSCVLPSPSEPETSQLVRNSDGDKLLPELGSGNSNLKPLKHALRPDDPTKSGQKRSSDRQEEMSVKRMKKLNEIKTMATAKKVPPVSLEMKEASMQKGEKKESIISPPEKLIKPESAKKLEPQGRSATRTSLLMKFPPQTSLPSIPHLKAKFARFGQIDHDATRVYWNTWMCKVVFKSKADAQAAYNHAIQGKSLFGHVEVSYRLRELELPVTQDASEASKQPVEDTSDASQLFGPGRTDLGGEARAVLHQQRQPAVQLKSCLKKTPGNGAHTGGPTKETPRVKFHIEDDQKNRSRSQKVVVVVSNDMVSDADKPSLLPLSSSSSMPLDFNSSDMKQTVDFPPPLLNLSRPDHSSEKPQQWQRQGNLASGELAKRNNNIDISRQMLGLLMKCNDIVSDLKNKLGYMPYHVL